MQHKEAHQENNSSSNDHKTKDHRRKRSRGHSTTGTVRNQLVNYYNTHLTRADEPSNKKSKKQRIEKPSDREIFILQKNDNFSTLPLTELANTEHQYGIENWGEAHYCQAIKNKNVAAGEIKGEEYVFENPPPEDLIMTNVPAADRPLAIQEKMYKQQLHDKEKAVLKPDRRCIINDMRNSVSIEIREQLDTQIPTFMNDPQVYVYYQAIQTIYELQYFEGRREDLEQKVTEAMADYFTGRLALTNLAKYGKFDLAAHKRLLLQLLRYRKVAGFEDMPEDEQAKYLVYSCCQINYLRQLVEKVKTNESEYKKMSTRTEEERTAATKFRILSTLGEAYKMLVNEKNLGILYESSIVVRASKQHEYEVQRSTVVQDKSNLKKNKKEYKNHCLLCGDTAIGNTHNTDNCRDLPAAILAFHIKRDENKGKSSYKTDSKTSKVKQPVAEKETKYKKQSYKVQIVVDNDLDCSNNFMKLILLF